MSRLSHLPPLFFIVLSTGVLLAGCDEDVVFGVPDEDTVVETSASISPSPVDFDGDGLSDDAEAASNIGTLDGSADTDQDGFSDGIEFVSPAGDPLNSFVLPSSQANARNRTASELLTDIIDNDGDGLGSNFESDFNLDDNDADIDDDGFSDALELIAGTNPFLSSDFPQRSTPPVSDGLERDINDPDDGDNDGLSDAREAFFGFDENNRDSDSDGFSDEIELLMGSDGLNDMNVPIFSVPVRPETVG